MKGKERKKSRKGGTPVISHMRRAVFILRAIRAGGFPNAQTLASNLDCDQRTIGRYVRLLRSLGAEIKYDAGVRGFYLANPQWRLEDVE